MNWERADKDAIQFGLVSGRNTTDPLFTYSQASPREVPREREVIVFCVCLSGKGFDRMPREMLKWVLKFLRVHEWVGQVVQELV